MSSTFGDGVVARTASSRAILLGLLIVAALIILVSAIRFQAPQAIGMRKQNTDFDAFHIAGQLAAEGRAGAAYDVEAMLAAQQAGGGAVSFLPWTYPPPYSLIVEGLAHLPIGSAFALFAAFSFAFYVWVLRRIAGVGLAGALLGVFPALLLNLRTGQNGFLTAGLIGLVLAGGAREARAGLPLGLMVIKPHLAVGTAALALLRRGWATLCVAALTGLMAVGLATLAYGPRIWSDFQGAVKQAAGFLDGGLYPFHRMNSIYAWLYTCGASAELALFGQLVAALAALAVLALAVRRRVAYRFQAALACSATLLVSPYSYDYDAAVLGVALAFVLPDLIARCSARMLAGLWALLWLACGYGMGLSAVLEASRGPGYLEQGGDWPSLAAPLLLAFYGIVAWVLMRPQSDPAAKP